MRRLTRVLVVGGIFGLCLVGSASPAAAANSVTVTPNSGLTNGQQISGTFSGYVPNSATIVALECSVAQPETSSQDCDTSTLVTGITSDASGSGSFQITVKTGTIGGRGNTCDAAHACFIHVANAAVASDHASAQITFAAEPTSSTAAPTAAAGGGGAVGAGGAAASTTAAPGGAGSFASTGLDLQSFATIATALCVLAIVSASVRRRLSSSDPASAA